MADFPVRWNKPKRIGLIFLKMIFFPSIVFFGFIILTGALFTFVTPAATSLMAQRTMQGVKVQPLSPVADKYIPMVLKNSLVYLEDHQFYTHHGLVLGAILEAYETNKKVGYNMVGGSTITQQLSRTIFLSPEKTFFRKGVEAGVAITLDFILSKKRLLELYVNLIEWGPGIFGADAASRHYYKYPVASLGLEALYRMAAIITNPVKYSVWNFEGHYQMRARYKALWDR